MRFNRAVRFALPISLALYALGYALVRHFLQH
jgi:uncharacterized protein YjaZ